MSIGEVHITGEGYNGFNCNECGSDQLRKATQSKAIKTEKPIQKLSAAIQKEIELLKELHKLGVITSGELNEKVQLSMSQA